MRRCCRSVVTLALWAHGSSTDNEAPGTYRTVMVLSKRFVVVVRPLDQGCLSVGTRADDCTGDGPPISKKGFRGRKVYPS